MGEDKSHVLLCIALERVGENCEPGSKICAQPVLV